MGKRSREDIEKLPTSKRLRSFSSDRLSLLSDEILLRALSYLSASDLVLCQRLSRRLKSLAGDSQLWKSLFYNRFVRPRASRIPGLRDQEASAESLIYSSKVSKWLDDDYLVRRGKATNWKRQYKLRHNWSKGSASVSETKVAEQPSTPPLLVRLRDDFVILADATTGLRACSLKGEEQLIANVAITPGTPTSLAIDDAETFADAVNILVGFADGSFAIYKLSKQQRNFVLQHTHPPSTNGAIHAVAYCSPYLLTMTGEPLLSLYRVEPPSERPADDVLEPLRLVSSLRSHTAYPPISLAIRTSSASVIASIAYAMPTWSMGWSVGLQEVRMSSEGTIVDSRMASASTKLSRAPSNHSPGRNGSLMGHKDTLRRRHEVDCIRLPSLTKPTSLSYNHPYLLSGHADNTLTLYMVTSNAECLSIGVGHRLWGHTSSVSGAHVGDRGKAVSVSALGNELRIWELEGGLSSNASRRRATAGEASIQIRPDEKSTTEITELDKVAGAMSSPRQDVNPTKGWVAFDEEKVVLLREKLQGAQTLVVYDFS